MYANRRFNWRYRLFFIWLALAMIILSACGLGNRDPVLGDQVEFQPLSEVTLACSASCAERGQCGTTNDGVQAVLGGWGSPMVENHDRLFPSGSRVTVLESNLQTIESVVDGSQSQLRFYRIQPQDGRPDGWVAGWCLAAQ